MSQPCLPADANDPNSGPRPFELDELCHDALHTWRDAARRRQLTVSLHLEDGFHVVYGCRQRVAAALDLLLGATIAAAPRGGRLTLAASIDEGAEVMRLVLRAGAGDAALLPPGALSRFVLSRAQRLLALDGGRVVCEDGARFELHVTLTVPLTEPPALAARPPSRAAPRAERAGAPRREILLAEDDDANIAVLREYLDARGFDVHVAHDGHEVLSLARCLRPEVIVMDVQMPGMDGLRAMRALRADPSARVRRIPIIALTALTMPGDRERCLDAGADVYLAKPARMRDVAALIEERIVARLDDLTGAQDG